MVSRGTKICIGSAIVCLCLIIVLSGILIPVLITKSNNTYKIHFLSPTCANDSDSSQASIVRKDAALISSNLIDKEIFGFKLDLVVHNDCML